MNQSLSDWVRDVAQRTRPAQIVWCDGSQEENDRLVQAAMLGDGTLVELDQGLYPGCYLHRSHPSDVARTEHLTFICSDTADEAGPTNNWMSPGRRASAKVWPLFDGAMKGRTMYVVPYLMGPAGSP
jgi:phosphoenolpyruvate carboxykinase (GTP)